MGNKSSSSSHNSSHKSRQNVPAIYSNHISAPTTPKISQNDFISTTPAGTIKSILKTHPNGSLSSESSSNSSSRQNVKFIEDFINSNRVNSSRLDNSNCPTIKKSAQINHNHHPNGRIGDNTNLSRLFSSSTETLTDNDKESTLKSRKSHNNMNNNKSKPVPTILYDRNYHSTFSNHTTEPFKSECTILPSFVETVRVNSNKFERTKVDKPYSTVNNRIFVNKSIKSPDFNNIHSRVYRNNNVDSRRNSPSELKKWNDTKLSLNGSMFNLSTSSSNLTF